MDMTTYPIRHLAINTEQSRTGKVRAVCEFCGRRSRWLTTPEEPGGGRREQPGVFDLPQGWAEAPYSADFQHQDGSHGSKYVCPTCEKRLHHGESLYARREPRR